MKIVIIGVGKLGFKLAEILSSDENSITVVDTKEAPLLRAADRLDVLSVQGNGAQLEILEQLDLAKTDLAVAVTDSDETNITICLLAKELGCPQVAARVRSPEYANQIEFFKERLGLDFITNPELDTAVDTARYVLRGYTAHMESFAQGRVGLFDVPLNALPQLVGKSLQETAAFPDILVAAISRGGQIIVPSGSTVLRENDILYLIGKRETLTSFMREIELDKRHTTRRVMIIGGGGAGFYLARRLLTSGVSVKLIEQAAARCSFLAANLKGALIIHGDGTDLGLLEAEGLAETDALVSFTGNDEENLMLALLGKQQGVHKAVAKVSRSSFVPIIEQLGIDRAVNPVLISAGEIARFIQGGQIASLSLLFGGQAEVVELIVPKDAPITKGRLSEAKIPPGLIVGTIVRGGSILIPGGDSRILAGDRVIIFCLQSEIPALQSLFYPQRRRIWHELWRRS